MTHQFSHGFNKIIYLLGERLTRSASSLGFACEQYNEIERHRDLPKLSIKHRSRDTSRIRTHQDHVTDCGIIEDCPRAEAVNRRWADKAIASV
jgi:hypothetical protein